MTLYRVDSPAATIISNIYFEGSDFLWCTKGSFRFEFSDREPLVLHAGEFIVTFPNRFVSIIGLESSNALRGGILVGPQHEEFLLRLGFWDCFTCTSSFSEHNLANLQNLLDKQTAGIEGADVALLRNVQFILNSILVSISTGRDVYFYEATKLLNINFLDGSASVKSLYDETHCSAPYLIEIFKAHGLHGPSEYLYRLQSWWACRMLTRTRLTLHEIARSCGFSSSSSFTRFFKKWMGITPAAVRDGQPYTRHAPTPLT